MWWFPEGGGGEAKRLFDEKCPSTAGKEGDKEGGEGDCSKGVWGFCKKPERRVGGSKKKQKKQNFIKFGKGNIVQKKKTRRRCLNSEGETRGGGDIFWNSSLRQKKEGKKKGGGFT